MTIPHFFTFRFSAPPSCSTQYTVHHRSSLRFLNTMTISVKSLYKNALSCINTFQMYQYMTFPMVYHTGLCKQYFKSLSVDNFYLLVKSLFVFARYLIV